MSDNNQPPQFQAGNTAGNALNERTYQEVEYLKRNLGPILVAALAEICIRRPADPIEYLGHWLLRWRYNEELKRRDVQNALEVVRRKTIPEAPRDEPIVENPPNVQAAPPETYAEVFVPTSPYAPSGTEEQLKSMANEQQADSAAVTEVVVQESAAPSMAPIEPSLTAAIEQALSPAVEQAPSAVEPPPAPSPSTAPPPPAPSASTAPPPPAASASTAPPPGESEQPKRNSLGASTSGVTKKNSLKTSGSGEKPSKKNSLKGATSGGETKRNSVGSVPPPPAT